MNPRAAPESEPACGRPACGSPACGSPACGSTAVSSTTPSVSPVSSIPSISSVPSVSSIPSVSPVSPVSSISSATVIAALREVSVASAQLRDSLAEHLDLRPSEVIALDCIDLCGDMQPRELAKHVALTSGGVTGLVDRLERAGYIRRQRHPTDRRGILLTATAQGRLAIAWYYQQYLAGLSDLLNRTASGDRLADLLIGPVRPAAPSTPAVSTRLSGHRAPR